MATPMKCHYEVLNVDRDASLDDLKKGYRKLALKWHPDKNPDNIDECTAQFRLVQQAYDVLSDPQERAWYDKHREAILRGGLGHGDNYEDNSLDVFQYFNTSCFTGFNDDEKGFYAVYGEVFRVIEHEDQEYMDDEDDKYPDFGDSQSSYEEVVATFYGFWESYCTAKSYVWVEKYDTRDAPDRRCRRLMEGENKKLRDAAKKNRNEEIRELVRYVRKRDPRVKAYKKLLEDRAEEISKKAKENRERQLKERLKHFENYKENEWAATHEAELAQLEANLAEHFGEEQEDEGGESLGEEDDQEEYYGDLFCVACNKAFKSEKSFFNHEKSKKHKESVALIREEMLNNGDIEEGEVELDQDLSDDEEEGSSTTKLSKKQKKKRKQQQKVMNTTEEDSLAENAASMSLNDSKVDDDSNKVKQSNKSKKARRKEKELQEKMKNATSKEATGDVDSENVNESESIDKNENSRLKPDTSSAVNGDVGTAENKSEEPSEGKKESQTSQKELKCNVCSSSFSTRNKLFQHIKELGHALQEGYTLDSGKGKKTKKKGKR